MQRTRAMVIVVATLIITTLMTTWLYRSLRVERDRVIAQQLRMDLERLASEINDRIREREFAVLRMARRYELHGYQDVEKWRADAENYMEHFDHLLALAIRDPMHGRSWMAGPSDFIPGPDILENLYADGKRDEKADTHNPLPTTSRPFHTADGRLGFAIETMIHDRDDHESDAVLVCTFDYHALIDGLLDQEFSLDRRIVIEDREFGTMYRHDPPQIGMVLQGLSIDVDLDGRKSTLRMTPGADQLRLIRSDVPELCLGFGLLLGVALAGALYLWFLDRFQKSRIEGLSGELDKERERLEVAVRGSMDGMWDWDLEKDTLWVSPRWYELLDYDKSTLDVSPSAFRSLVHPDDQLQAVNALRHLLKRNRNLDVEVRLLTGVDAYRWYRIKGSAVRDADGRAVRMAGLIQDIHDRRQTQDALNEQRRLLQSILDSMNEGVVAIGHDHKLLLLNPAAIRIIGSIDTSLPADAWPKRFGLRDPKSGDLLEAEDLPILRALDGAEIYGVDASLHHGSTGEQRMLLCSAAPIPDEVGRPVAAVMVFHDVTAQRRIRERLEEANRELEQFAYVASHDLQEPLRTISSYLQLLERRFADSLDQDAHDFIHFAVDGAERMHQLIRDLLELSRVNSSGGKMEATDLNEVVRNVLHDLSPAIRESDAEVAVGDLPQLRADRNQIHRLIQNLVGNALKFRGSHPPKIAINAVRRATDWLFAVSDNGIGFDQKYAERIFVVFKRLHTREEYPGTGMGLAICRKIVERHGGSIWVESSEDQGATFYFTIPFRDETEVIHHAAA